MKNVRYLEAASSILLMLSKYFLSISSVFGWWLSIVGYVIAAIFNTKIKLKIVPTVVLGLALLSVYGLYKWTYEIPGLQVIDFLIISLSGVFAIYFIIKEAKIKESFWVLQSISTVLRIFAFIAIGMKMEIGWYALLLNHINNICLYYQKKAYIVLTMQIISAIIVLVKLFAKS